MKKGNYLLLPAAVLTVSGLLTATEVRAQLFPPDNGAPPRTCNLDTTVTIVAGENGDPTAPFPRVVSCPGPDCPPSFSGSGQFLLWEYLATYNGVNPSNLFLSVSGNTEIFFATPTAAVSTPICAGDSQSKAGQKTCEVRFLRFNANGSTFAAAYLTGIGWSPRIATAGAKAGNFEKFCLLAGAGSPTTEPNQALADQQSYQLPGCTVAFSVTPTGKVIPGTIAILDGAINCTTAETNTPIVVDGKPVEFVGPVQFTQAGSCNYSWTNTTGGQSTVFCTTCCIKASTNQCVQKSTLSNPTTQCKAGTL